jgi:hypothetical protein
MFGSKDSTTRLEDEDRVPEQRRPEDDADYVASTDHDADGRSDEERAFDAEAGNPDAPAADTNVDGGRPAAEVNRANGTVYSANTQYDVDDTGSAIPAGDDADLDRTPRDDLDEAHDSVGIAPAPTDGGQVAPAVPVIVPVDGSATPVASDETVDRYDETDRAETDRAETDRAETDRYDETDRDETGVEAAQVSDDEPVAEQDLKPGVIEAQPVGAFWADGDAQAMRERWRELQLRFIDDPQSVADEAQRLVDEAVANVTAKLNEAKDGLADWREGPGTDTERLRAAVRGYRDFLDRVLGL